MKVHKKFIDRRSPLVSDIILARIIFEYCTMRYALPAAMSLELVRCHDHWPMVLHSVYVNIIEIVERSLWIITTTHTYIIFCFKPIVGDEDKILVHRFIVDHFRAFNVSVDR